MRFASCPSFDGDVTALTDEAVQLEAVGESRVRLTRLVGLFALVGTMGCSAIDPCGNEALSETRLQTGDSGQSSFNETAAPQQAFQPRCRCSDLTRSS